MIAAPVGYVTVADGRRVAYIELGDVNGLPVVHHHGAPASRLFIHPDEATYRGFRFISFDRAGFGLSEPLPGHGLSAVADDVRALCDSLGIGSFGVLGTSMGGPYALATAAALPERVVAVAIMSGPAPIDAPGLDFFAGMPEANVEGYRVAMAGREADWAEMEPMVAMIQKDPHAFLDVVIGGMSEPDRAQAANPAFREMLAAAFHEGMRQNGAGWLDDDMVAVSAWDFELQRVRCPVRIWHGAHDTNVPAGHSEYLARVVPDATLKVIAEAGHGLFPWYREALEWIASQSAEG